MSLPFNIAKRYLFAKKSHHAINVISWISVCGIALATLAMVCTLSVFNGFQDLFSSLFCSFDPQIKITVRHGKVFDASDVTLQQIQQLKEVAVFTQVLEENALVSYHDRQVTATIKGVSENFNNLTRIDSIMLGGCFELTDGTTEMGVMGVGLASMLGTGIRFVDPLRIIAPKRNARYNALNPYDAFSQLDIYISGVFSVDQPEYDEKYVITSLTFARELFRYNKNDITAIELKLKDGVNSDRFKNELRNLLGERYLVQNQYEQQEDFFKMMNIEKWMSFLILCFVMLIATFNIIGSLSMLIFDKRNDIVTLRNLGANEQLLSRIFLIEGRLISIAGAVVGIFLGVILCLVQQYFGLLRLGGGSSFLVEAYPVRVVFTDILLIFVTVIGIGLLAVWYPVKYLLGKNWLTRI